MKNHINNAFEALTPSAEQKVKMRNAISTQMEVAPRTGRTQKPVRRRMLAPVAAAVLLFVLSATAYAATDSKVISLIKNQVNQILFANDDSIELKVNNAGDVYVGVNGTEGDWLVKETGGRLILTIDGKEINITDALTNKGYYYYDYRDNAEILHRVYVVKNAGGSKDYAERWYSQLEWIPEHGLGGGSRGSSGPLVTAIMSAEDEAANGSGNLDTLLQQYLKKYWNEYGN